MEKKRIGCLSCPLLLFGVEMVFILGIKKTLEEKRKKPLSLQGLIHFLFNSYRVQRKPNFDIGEKWFPL